MIQKCLLFGVLSIVLLAGCSSISNARNAQSAASRKSSDDAPALFASVDLRKAGLEELVRFALTNRPSMVSAALDVKDARLSLKQISADAPLASGMPWNAFSVSASAGYDASSSSHRFRKHDWNAAGDPSGAISLGVLIWDFGRYEARARSLAESVVAAEQSHIAEGYSVFEEVSGAYFSFLEKRALLEVARTNEYEYAVHLEQAEQRVASGEAKQLDLLRAKLDLAQAKEKTVNSLKDLETSGAELIKALGLEASSSDWRKTVDPGKDALARFRGFPDSDCSAAEAFSFARTNSPAMRIARARLRSASADVDWAVSDLMPEVSASTSIGWTDPLWVWRWGVDAVASIFQGFRKVTAVDRAAVSLEKASAEVDLEEQALSVAVQIAVAERDNFLAAIETCEESLLRAKENLDLVRRQYEVGESNRADYTQAVSDYVEAMGGRVSAFYGKQRSEAAIFRLLGVYPVYQENWIVKEGNP